MNQVKTGNFIAELRREKGLTQEALGEILGVTNKTVSRWENGNYLPNVETLKKLSDYFSVSINEILSGERIDSGAYAEKAEENLSYLLENSAFTLKERYAFWQNKWLREHTALIIISCTAYIALLACVIGFHCSALTIAAASILGFVCYLVLRNQMMSYTEGKIYDSKITKKP